MLLCVVIMYMSKLGSNYISAYSTSFCNVFGRRTTGNMIYFRICYITSGILANVPVLVFIYLPNSSEIVSFCHRDYHNAIFTSYRRCTITIVIIWNVVYFCFCSYHSTILTSYRGFTVTIVIIWHVVCFRFCSYHSTILTSYRRCTITVIIVWHVVCFCCCCHLAAHAANYSSCAVSVIIKRSMGA